MLIDVETGLISGLPEGAALEAPPKAALPIDIPGLIKAALAGVLPRDPSFEWEDGMPRTLNAAHIAMLLDRTLGYSNAEIAAKHDYSPVQVSRVLRHPDAQYLIGAMMGKLADRITDPVERLKTYAHEAINTKISLMRTSENEGLRNQIATDILDRAGYGSRRQVDVNETLKFEMPAETADAVRTAAHEARRAATADFSRFLSRVTQEGESAGSQPVLPEPGPATHLLSAAGGGSPRLASGASPGDSPETEEAAA